MNEPFDIKQLLDAINAAFGRHPLRTADYTLHEGDVVTVGEVSYTVRAGDFVDPAQATAAELAMCLLCEGADVTVVQDEHDSEHRRVEPRPQIRRASSDSMMHHTV